MKKCDGDGNGRMEGARWLTISKANKTAIPPELHKKKNHHGIIR